MQRKLIMTGDGSHTVSVPVINATYHSIHGAIRESMHVFIQAGLFPLVNRPMEERMSRVNVLEMGFGTGLNALLTMAETERMKTRIHYTAIELFPLDIEEVQPLNYCQELGRTDLQGRFEQLHNCEWEQAVSITGQFLLTKHKVSLLNFLTCRPLDFRRVNLIYFDAFAPSAQPELWTTKVFEKLYSILLPGGILVTYCSKGQVKRDMQTIGFKVEKLPGPKGKREMLRGRRPYASYNSS